MSIQNKKKLMNIKNAGMYKRPMNFFEKIIVGWQQVRDNRWEWYYHLTEADEKMYHEFWWYLNMDFVQYVEEFYYNGN